MKFSGNSLFLLFLSRIIQSSWTKLYSEALHSSEDTPRCEQLETDAYTPQIWSKECTAEALLNLLQSLQFNSPLEILLCTESEKNPHLCGF